MKPLILGLALFAVAEQQQCKNPLDSLTGPNANNNGPRTPEELCAVVQGNFGPAFYCSTAQTNLQFIPANTKGWLGYCAPAGESLGTVGYSATTFTGIFDQAKSFSNAQAVCNQLGSSLCGSIVRCTRP